MSEPDARVGDVGTSPILAKPVSTPPAPHGTTPAVDSGDSWWRSDASEALRRNLALVGVLLMIFVVGAITAPEVFLDAQRLWDNEMTVLRQSAAIGVVTVGMTFVIIGGGIDLSVGALLALSSVWATTVATQQFGPAGIVFTALAVGTIGGLINGLLISYGRIVPFIATLAMLVAARGLAQLISGKLTQRVSTENRAINEIAEINVLGIPLLVVILLVVAALGWVLLNRTTFGRRTFAVGGNPEAARLAGINLRIHTVLLYVLSGLCCGIAAIMVTSLGNAGSSTHGDLYELDAIAAAIIGGTVLAGGRGSIVGAILGVVIFSGITNLFVINNMVQEWRLIVKGAIIVAAVLVQQFGFGWRRRKTPKVAAT
jgi:ribose transport system permease protein